MIKKALKYLGSCILIYVLLCLVTPFNKNLRNRSISNQIAYLSDRLDKGYDDKLQNRFPEGKLFSNALLALSTIEYCVKNKVANKYHAKIVDSCIRRLQSESALATFDPHIIPKYGMFYNGWSNLVYATYRKSQLFSFSAIPDKVIAESKHLEDRLSVAQRDSLRVLDTYTEANWPADNMIGIVSMSDKALQRRWINAILESATHSSGLIHHSGSETEVIRGSSSAMITYCLSATGYDEIEKYSDAFKDLFIDEYFGVQLVKEHENGTSEMDVDSGPVVFGYGASATIMNIKAQASLGSPKSKYTWAAMNLISVPINLFRKKYYLLKKEPMLDLFMLWTCVELS